MKDKIFDLYMESHGIPKDGLMRLPSGKRIDILRIKPEDICIEDIAHALSMKCRWNGWTKKFYSIAEHSIHVASFVPPELKFEALLHDAAEAYLFDIPRPVYLQFQFLITLRDYIEQIIAEKFGLHFGFDERVIQADNYTLSAEYEFCILTDSLDTLSPEEAKKRFLEKACQFEKFHIPIDWSKEGVDAIQARLNQMEFDHKLRDELREDLLKKDNG